MKTSHLTLGLGLLILSLLSCQKHQDPTPAPGNAKVKRILLYFSLDSENPTSIVKEFEYDENWRITKTSSPMYQDGKIVGTISYDLYYYNNSDQLIKKENYNANLNSPTGFINLINYYYTYSEGGTLSKVTIEYPRIGQRKDIIYEYKNNRLIRIKNLNDKNELESYVLNYYDAYGRLITEEKYTYDDKLISTTTNSYEGQLLVKSDIFQGDIHLREIKRSYDSNNNLLKFRT